MTDRGARCRPTEAPPGSGGCRIRVEPDLSDESLNHLFAAAWEDHSPRDFGPVLARSLTWVAAFAGPRLVGFVNVAWDGGVHGFILDTTVHPDFQRRGIGTALMREAAKVAAARDIEWLHVDFEPHLESFYRGCGYRPTAAGLLRVEGTTDG